MIKLDRQDAAWILTVALGTTGVGKYFSNGYDLELPCLRRRSSAGLNGDVMASCGVGPAAGAGE
jgi:hypothetical protein